MNQGRAAKIFAWVLMAAVGCATLAAQPNSASITGVVTDAAEAVIAGARIMVRNLNTGVVRTAESNEIGYYTVANLDPGPYEFLAEAPGFKTYRTPELRLEVGQVLRLDVHMTLGAITESVTVIARPAALETERGAIQGDVIAHEEVQELPLEGRDFTDLAFVVPGVFPRAQGGQGSAMNINGARATNTNFYVDGFNNRNARAAAAQARPNLDALQEFKMEVGGFSAEYGRFAGGILNMVLRSGTNEVHGALFEYLRNNLLDARSFFAPEKDKLRRHQFGATVGGPVVRNRTFYLISYEGYTQILGRTRLARVPGELERSGDFSEVTPFLKDPLAGGACNAKNASGCFPGAVIPPSRIHPVALKVLRYYPLPNRPGQAFNYLARANDDDKWHSILGKIDHNFGAADKLAFRYQSRVERTVDPWAGSDLGIFGNREQDHRSLAGLDFNHLFSPAWLAEWRVGYSRNRTRQRGRYYAGRDMAAELGLPSLVSEPAFQDWPHFFLQDYAELGTGNNMPLEHYVTDIQGSAKLTWMKSRHTVKAGFEVSRVRFNQPYFNNQRGTYRFLGRWTGNSVGDLLLGLLNNVTRTLGINRNYLRQTSYGAFINDDFKLRRNLTLNLGLRYELNLPPYDRYDRWMNFIPELGRIVIADDRTIPNLPELLTWASMEGKVTTAAQAGFPRALVYADYTNLAPRLGIAWRPRGGSRFVVRSGYGLFYAGEILNPIRNDLANNFPFVVRQNYTRSSSQPAALTLDNPFPDNRMQIQGTTSAAGFEPHAATGYLQVWNLTLEREVREGAVFTMGYVGSKGTHLGRKYNINQPYRTLELYRAGLGFPRPYPGMEDISYYTWGANSIYNSLEVSLRRRGTRGLFWRIGYLYSKSIDEASQFTDSSDGGYGGAISARNLRLERARSDWDRGHVFTAVFNWELPLGRGKRFLARLRGWRRWLVEGWQLSGAARSYTGAPFTVMTSDVEWNLGETDRPNRIGRGVVPQDAFPGKKGADFRWFKVQDFEEVPCVDPAASQTCLPESLYGFSPFAIGNSGRNILDGPGLFVVDLGLRKNIRLGERQSLQFRWDSFNAPNRTNFLLPNKYVNQPQAGFIDRVGNSGRQGGPRVMQLALTYRF